MDVKSLSRAASPSSYQGQGSPSVSNASARVAETKAAEAAEVKVPSPVEAGQINNAESTKFEINEKNRDNGQASMAAIRDAVEKINAHTASVEAKFGIHEQTNRVTIKMVDRDSGEVVKEFPAEETLDLIAKAWELAGIMVDERR